MDRDPHDSSPASQPVPTPSEPAFPADPFAPPPSSSLKAPMGPTASDCNMAALAHGAGAFTSFMGCGFAPPLIVWLISKEKSPFPTAQAAEAFNFQITLLLAFFVSALLCLVAIGFLLLPLIWCWGFVLSIVAAVKASRGESYRYPLTLRLMRGD